MTPDQITALTRENEALEAQCAAMKEAIDYFGEQLPKRLQEAESNAKRCDRANDSPGLNWYRGTANGLTIADIYLYKLKRAADGASAAEICKEMGWNPHQAADAPIQQWSNPEQKGPQ